MKPLHFLIGAGPTREAIDAVRYLTNASSGRTGYAVAAAAHARGHTVTLVSGPVSIPAPKGVTVLSVTSARDMKRAMDQAFRAADVVVMAAAVADYRPKKAVRGKMKKGTAALTLELVPNPDILAGLGARKGNRVLIGFALETRSVIAHARGKLEKKNLDMIVANGPENLDRSAAAVHFVRKDGTVRLFEGPKSRLGTAIVRHAEALAAARMGGHV